MLTGCAKVEAFDPILHNTHPSLQMMWRLHEQHLHNNLQFGDYVKESHAEIPLIVQSLAYCLL